MGLLIMHMTHGDRRIDHAPFLVKFFTTGAEHNHVKARMKQPSNSSIPPSKGYQVVPSRSISPVSTAGSSTSGGKTVTALSHYYIIL